MNRSIDKKNALGLTAMEATEACIALQNTDGAVTIPGIGTITPKDRTVIAKIQAELRKPTKPGEFGKYKLPATFKEIPMLAISTMQVRAEAQRIAQYRTAYGLEGEREYLYPHEVTQADFVQYGFLGDLRRISKQQATNHFEPVMRPMGDMAHLHRVCVLDAWRNRVPIPRIVITLDYAWLLTDSEPWMYCYLTYRDGQMQPVEIDSNDPRATHIVTVAPKQQEATA
jgi:hypothetical protein